METDETQYGGIVAARGDYLLVVIGIVIAALTAVGFISGFAYEVYNWSHNRPSVWYRGIGVRYIAGAVDPWPDLTHAIDIMVDYLEESGHADLGGFWIEIVPWNGVVRTKEHFPTDDTLLGTVRVEAYFMGLRTREVLVIRQRLFGTTKSPESPLTSTLFHEFAEHYLPWRITRDWNTGHAETWKAVRRQLEQNYG